MLNQSASENIFHKDKTLLNPFGIDFLSKLLVFQDPRDSFDQSNCGFLHRDIVKDCSVAMCTWIYLILQKCPNDTPKQDWSPRKTNLDLWVLTFGFLFKVTTWPLREGQPRDKSFLASCCRNRLAWWACTIDVHRWHISNSSLQGILWAVTMMEYDGMYERTYPAICHVGSQSPKKGGKSWPRFSICNPWLVNSMGQLPQLRVNFTEELQLVFEASFP